MGDAAMDSLAGSRGIGREAAYDLAVAQVPGRRVATPGEVAEAVAWLASQAASSVNGAALTVDAGAVVVDVGTLAFKAGASTATNERRE